MGKKILTVILLMVTVIFFAALASASGRKFYEPEDIPRTSIEDTVEYTTVEGETEESIEETISIEESTEAPTEVPTEAPTEAPTETPTEAPTEAPTEVPTEAPTEAPTEVPTEALTETPTEAPTEAPIEPPTQSPVQTPTGGFINPEGSTLLTRINPPKGYARKEVQKNSFADFVLNYPLKEHGAPILLYNGTPGPYQHVHTAVFNLPIENEDFQQCADAVMRMYAEYYWHTGQKDKIAFHLTSGLVVEYTLWRDGYRLQNNANKLSWVKTADYDDSYLNFTKYLRIVFAYAGTLSMDRYESDPISMDDLQIGDVWLEGNTPGHIMMVVDICYDETGRKAFLLADGHTPAMDFHLMKNFAHENNPWYYEDEIKYPLVTFAHTYMKAADLQRLTYPKQ